jgi:hypothetical protein
MRGKMGLVLAFGAALLGTVGSRASAQIAVRGGFYVAAPPVYVEVVPGAPGPDYIWIPQYHRWVFRGRDRDWAFDRDRRFERYRVYDRDRRFGDRDRR